MQNHNFSFSFLPRDTARQQVTELEVSIPGCPAYRESRTAFDGRKLYGCIRQPHDRFEIQVRGKVTTGLDIYEERIDSRTPDLGVFRAQSALTMPGEAIRCFHTSLAPTGADYDKVLQIMRGLHRRLRYQPGATTAHEPAEAALALGAGVCQDYAHILLSLLRLEGIPARYVTGMVPGEGASHAWVEALCGSYWYGFDPTNNYLVDDRYIRAGCGRDSSDCAVIRGTFCGLAAQQQRELVIVQEETL